MRQVFCNGLVQQAHLPEFVFLTGDLGFKALEPLQDALGPRFINAGVSEQNMISVAAGLARSGLRPWAYSIAPFLYARPFEQIRNDVCFHDLPVILAGNGGGYGYGVMGSSHHALEDYGCLLTLPHMRAFVPAFDSDVNTMIPMLMQCKGPAYFRLGLSEEPKDWPIPAYAPWRKLLGGNGPVLAGVGPLLGGMLTTLQQLREDVRPEIWLVTELPIANVPDEFIAGVRRARRLFVVEEHTAHGGFGQMLAHHLAAAGVGLDSFIHKHALGYVSGLYGSQRFHRAECGLDPASIAAAVSVQ
jgi:transketolase